RLRPALGHHSILFAGCLRGHLEQITIGLRTVSPTREVRVNSPLLALLKWRCRTPRRGNHKKAQGNALGTGMRQCDSPARAAQQVAASCYALSGLPPAFYLIPRALPWAFLWLPLRGEYPKRKFTTGALG